MTDSGSETCDVELAIAGVMLGVAVIFPMEGVSVDTGTIDTPVLVVGTVLL